MSHRSDTPAHKNKEHCIFCEPEDRIILENDLAYAMFDKFPVSEGHALVIPKRHVAGYFDLLFEEQIACLMIINDLKKMIDKKYNPDGYNVGVNVGRTAGQSVFHVHIHLIPRYEGDIDNPLGGIRNVIANKADYITKKFFWNKG